MEGTREEEVVLNSAPAPFVPTHRRLTIEIDVHDSGDNVLRRYVERALHVWMARECPEDGLTEIVPSSDYSRTPEVAIHLNVKHEFVSAN